MTQVPNDNQTSSEAGNTDNVLDQVINAQHQANLQEFRPSQVIGQLLDILNDQEQEILRRRYALLEAELAKRQTLEEIGKHYNLTRERIRQIENRAIKKIKDQQTFEGIISPLETIVNQVLEEHGGVMEENYLLNKLADISETPNEDTKKINFEKQVILFMLDKLSDKIEKVAADETFMSGWRTKAADIENFKKILINLHKFIETKGDPIARDKIIQAFRESSPEVKGLAEKVILSALEISARTKRNPFDEWGLADWRKITPKRMGDKILMVLEKHGKPLHFTEIANLINKHQFDKKTAHPATVHNELIMGDDFVLVGRGIYGLKKWGYKTGDVSQVVSQILKENGPMTREEIIDEVLDQRMVKKGTVVLALSDKTKFKKLEGGRYSVVN